MRLTKSKEYKVWSAMIQRCENPKNNSYYRYGARGISVCKRWRYGEGGKTGFECYLADMGKRPSNEHTVDRKDNDGNYEPDNCRWATRIEQAANRQKWPGFTPLTEEEKEKKREYHRRRKLGLPTKMKVHAEARKAELPKPPSPLSEAIIYHPRLSREQPVVWK